jgi:hypothetical protein
VPFIRTTRDKRGVESTYVMHVYRPAANAPSRTRVLYLFRSPAHVRVGRRPLDPEVMEALEHTHPDLTFDWSSLHREAISPRPEPREMPSRDRRRDRPPPRPTPAPVMPAPAPAPAPVAPPDAVDDGSVLCAVLGAVEATRLRRRYEEVVQRITRRARTPEDRTRLLEETSRSNPAEWADEAVVREQAPLVEALWNALLTQLPSRRRGRRAGRRQAGEAIMDGDAVAPSGSDNAYVDSSTDPSRDPDDGDRLGTTTAAADLPDDD